MVLMECGEMTVKRKAAARVLGFWASLVRSHKPKLSVKIYGKARADNTCEYKWSNYVQLMLTELGLERHWFTETVPEKVTFKKLVKSKLWQAQIDEFNRKCDWCIISEDD